MASAVTPVNSSAFLLLRQAILETLAKGRVSESGTPSLVLKCLSPALNFPLPLLVLVTIKCSKKQEVCLHLHIKHFGRRLLRAAVHYFYYYNRVGELKAK